MDAKVWFFFFVLSRFSSVHLCPGDTWPSHFQLAAWVSPTLCPLVKNIIYYNKSTTYYLIYIRVKLYFIIFIFEGKFE